MEAMYVKTYREVLVRWLGGFSLLLVVTVFVVSCTEKNCVTVCDECREECGLRPTPDSLLSFLAEAYEGKNLEAYSEALHDSFQFEFTDDIADSLGLPPESPWWAKDQDVASTENMFENAHVRWIECEFSPFGVGMEWRDCEHEFISGDPPDTTLIQGVCKVFEPEIKVYIEEPGQEERILWVHESILAVMVTPDPYSEGEWVIVRLVETKKNPLMSATEASSWGSIKAMFK
jgi:hypothetical protein